MTESGELSPTALPGRRASARGVPNDADLVRKVRGGSGIAAEELVARHWDRAYRIAFAILGDAHFAEDVTQEAMVSMLGNLGRFDVRRSFEPWLHRIVSNRALDCCGHGSEGQRYRRIRAARSSRRGWGLAPSTKA